MGANSKEEDILSYLSGVKGILETALSKDLPAQMKQVKVMMAKLQPKTSKRILIGKHKATASLGHSNNVMIDFDSAEEGKKYFDSLQPI